MRRHLFKLSTLRKGMKLRANISGLQQAFRTSKQGLFRRKRKRTVLQMGINGKRRTVGERQASIPVEFGFSNQKRLMI